MKKKTAVLILFVLACCITLVSCANPTVKEPSAEETLITLLANFEEIGCYCVSGKITKNNENPTAVSFVADRENKRIELVSDGKTYDYYATYLMETTDKTVVSKINTTYAETLRTLAPFVLNSFTYDKNNRGEVYKTDGKIIVTFLNKGVKKSFDSSLNIDGGVLTIGYKDGVITDSVLTTHLTENGVTVPFYARYEYQTANSEDVGSVPFVSPTDSLNYASYAMSILSEKYVGKTLRTVAGKKDTGVSLKSIPVTAATVSSVTSITNENYVTVVITYSEKQIIPGLSSSVESFRITFDENYVVNGININEGIRFNLE